MKRRLGILVLMLLTIHCSSYHSKSDLKFSGTVEMTEYSVGAAVPGILKDLYIEEGVQVKKGDVLGHLNHYDQAKREYDRRIQLSKVVSQEEMEKTRQAMEDQTIVSPINGITLVKIREPGEVLAAGSPVAVLGNYNKMWVKIFVPENMISQLSYDQQASIYVDGVKGPFPGHIMFIGIQSEFTPRNVQTKEERVTQTFGVKVAFDNPKATIHPGVFADVVLHSKKNP